MFERELATLVRKRASNFPVVLVTGPRQSGKTTLCRALFPTHRYVSLEAPDQRRYAREDPRGFLREVAEGAVIDEVQNVPELLSYLQGEVDERPSPGRFVLTGSQHFGLSQAVSQSLAGRVGLAELLPLSVSELGAANQLVDVWTTVFKGGYPALYDRKIEPADWFSGYVATYVERDVRQLLNVTDSVAFETFVSLAAARTAQLVELSGLGADAGVTQPTARKWLSVLETSYLLFRLPPYFRNLGKRLVKTPKLHFFDSGLLCYLLRIRSADQLRLHPLRGAIFESWVTSEIVKAYRNAGERPEFTFFRDRHGLEADGVLEFGMACCVLEVKSSATVPEDAFRSLDKVLPLLAQPSPYSPPAGVLVYAGDETRTQRGIHVLPWRSVGAHPWPGLSSAT
jgi:uncharacterized protein